MQKKENSHAEINASGIFYYTIHAEIPHAEMYAEFFNPIIPFPKPKGMVWGECGFLIRS